jgi:hypothetical protein
MQNASSTRLSLRLPIEQMVPICERAQQDGSNLFTYVAQKIGSRLTLNGMDFDMPPSCEHLRVTLKLPLKDALRLHNAARAQRLSAGDWITELLQSDTPAASKDREPLQGSRFGPPKTLK